MSDGDWDGLNCTELKWGKQERGKRRGSWENSDVYIMSDFDHLCRYLFFFDGGNAWFLFFLSRSKIWEDVPGIYK